MPYTRGLNIFPKRRPLIGVTGPVEGGKAAWWFTRIALFRAGARATRITTKRPMSVDRLDGLIIGGGADVSLDKDDPTVLQDLPKTREFQPGKGLRLRDLFLGPFIFIFRLATAAAKAEPDPDRDTLERELIEGALQRNLPILGICRGAQILNTVLGGTLHSDISDFYIDKPYMWTLLPRKNVRIDPQSFLGSVLCSTEIRVNALHHQAIDELGQGITVCGKEENGIIQAIELQNKRFAVGVQWHPEYLPQLDRQQALFRSLTRAAAKPQR